MCEHEPHCGVRVNWQRISHAIADALASVTLADMVKPLPKRTGCDSRCMALRIGLKSTNEWPFERNEIETALNRRYAAGFITDIETDSLPPGLNEDVVRAISQRKNEPEWMTEWRLDGVSPLVDDADAALGQAAHRADRFPGDQLFLRAEEAAEIAGRSRSETAGNL